MSEEMIIQIHLEEDNGQYVPHPYPETIIPDNELIYFSIDHTCSFDEFASIILLVGSRKDYDIFRIDEARPDDNEVTFFLLSQDISIINAIKKISK